MSEQKKQDPGVVNFTIDGTQVTVPKGTTVYTAATKLGIDIPIFCYQDRMPPFGACRMCMVEVEKMGKPQTSCTLEAAEGMVVRTQSAMSSKAREQMLEFLLINHPLDCPVCDKGGECPLQDNTMKFGPGKSRFYEEKRHFEKPIPLSSVLMLDRERCIICARCTRFGDLIAGDHALQFVERGFKTEVAVPEGGTAESKFIGNTIAICPVGALTSKVYRFKARPWDNKSTNTTCTLCPVGCSMILDERDGEIMRTRAEENPDVNDMWLCDKGWFGYEFSDHKDRLQKPLIRRGNRLEEASWDEALSLIAARIEKGKPGCRLAAFGGNPLTTEENYLFQKLMREGIGAYNIDHRIGMPTFSTDEEGLMPGMENSLRECEDLSYAILFGLDLTEEFPLIWLRLKQAINRGAKVIFVGHYAPEMYPHLEQTILHAPGQEMEKLKELTSKMNELSELGQGAIFVGRQYLDQKNRSAILSELVKWRQGKNAFLNIMEGRGNSFGARLAGMRPDKGPFGEPAKHVGLNAVEVLEQAANHGWDYLHVAGADPATKFPKDLWNKARSKIEFLVVQDLFLTETAKSADVVLPTLCFMEKNGHFVNIEGRPQKLHPGKSLPPDVLSDGEIFLKIALKLNFSLILDRAFTDKLKVGRIQLHRPSQIDSKAPIENENKEAFRATFAHALFDKGVRMQHDPHLLQLVKEPFVRINTKDACKLNISNHEEIHFSVNGKTIKAKVKLDDKVAEKTVVLPLGFTEVPVHNFAPSLYNGMEIEIKKN